MCKKLICLVSFILVLSAAGSIRADLVGHWTLDDGSGTTAIDISGNGNDGTLMDNPDLENPAWIPGIRGGAMEFYGTGAALTGGDHFDCGSDASLNISGPTSMALWIRPGLDDPEGQGLETAPMCKADMGASPSWSYQVRYGWGGPEPYMAFTFNTTPRAWAFVGKNLELGEWAHIACSFDGETLKCYLNGEQTDETPMGPITISPASVLIGSDGWGCDWNGAIDDVRIYDHALSENELLSAMEGEVVYRAWGPIPKDGDLYPDTWVNISWKPGPKAVSHDVYFSDNFDDVNAGAESTFVGNQGETFMVVGFPGFAFPDGLTPGTTYYWRIDEVNDTEPNSPWKGDVWSFSVPPKTAYFPVPADGGDSVAVDAALSWTAGFGAKLHTVYFGDNFDEVDNATGGQTQGTVGYSPDTLEMAKTYYWRVDEFDVVETHKGDVWSFTTEGAVGSPNPAKGAVDVTQTPVLTWVPGVFADTYKVYFGADAASLELKGSGNLGDESFEPGQLEWNTTYYWRVNEENTANADSPWTGPLWSFTTANFLIIDDMEGYNDLDEGEAGSNRIYLAWIDGFDNPATNGCIVGYANAPFAEQNTVHGGNQSMPFEYNNSVGKSEATLTLTSNRDWTVNGVNTLTIWYRGGSSNAAETMYVTLNGSASVDNDNPDAAQKGSWTQWNVPLQAFADQGVNLANVTSITLGLRSVTGGAGMLYFDDIRLYPLP
ncbi:MAG: hypothetical protein GY845_16035 [Planctomycetes bacterium]|nr:hypothetical protein [Planctomycetota bacterium]